MSHLFLLRLHIKCIKFLRCYFNRCSLMDCKPRNRKVHIPSPVICKKREWFYSRSDRIWGYPVFPKIRCKSRRMLASTYRIPVPEVHTLFQLVNQTDSLPSCRIYRRTPSSFSLDLLIADCSCFSTIAAERSKSIAGQALGILHGTEHLPHRQSHLSPMHMMFTGDVIHIPINLKFSILGWHLCTCFPYDMFFHGFCRNPADLWS